MASDKVTVMILNVDLKCSCCYKKVKKVLCKFPQIRDQVFDQDKNKVKITVVCCNPEKLRDKICCKGGKAIQSIEIVEDIPKPTDNPKPKPKPEDKPKPKPDPKPEDKPKPKPDPKPEDKPKPKPDPKPSPPVIIPTPIPVQKPPPKVDPPKPVDPPPKVDPPKPVDPPKVDPPMPVYCPPVYPVPISACCQECYEGRSGGPCHDFGYNNFGRPVPPPPGPCYNGYGYPCAQNRPCRCDYYFSEENPQGCSIM